MQKLKAFYSKPLNLDLLKMKSVSFSWELMFTCSMFTTDDMDKQHQILNKIAELLNEGTLKSTLTTTLKGFTMNNLKEVQMQESEKTIGKTVIQF